MENEYSFLDSTDALLFLSIDGSGGISVPGEMKTGSYLEKHPYTFPEFHDVDGTQADYAMGLNTGNALTKSLNNAISFVLKPVTAAGRKELGTELPATVFGLATAISNSGYDVLYNNINIFKSYTYAGKLKWEIKQASVEDMKSVKNVLQGSTHKDYVVIKNHSGDTVTLPYAVPKGYAEGQELYAQQSTQVSLSTITQKLSWGHVVYLSSEQLKNGVTVQNNSQIKQQDKISKAIGDFLNSFISGIASALGLYDVEELMFNAGNRGATHYFGIMPLSWLNPVNILNLIATVISMVVIGISIIRMLIKRNMAAISPSIKVELMDGVKDLFIVATGIMLFMPALFILLNFNNVIVSAMRDMAPSGVTLGLTSGGDFIGIVAAVMNFAYFFIIVMLNITYITRAVTLAILIGFAPFFISLFAAGPAAKKISGTWMKELISNIFMQTFNAALLLVFSNIGSFGGLSVIEKFALLISFIPLTKFFKGSLMNLGSGSDAAADKTAGAFSSFATGLVAGSLHAGFDGKSEKKGKIVPAGGETNVSAPTADGNVPSANVSAEGNNTKDSFRGSLAKTLKNATAKGEGKRLAAKTAGMMAGAGLSLGSAATGGSPLLGNSALFSGAQSIANQVEGWGIHDEPTAAPETSSMTGADMKDMGVSGFDNENIVLNPTVRGNINESPESRSEFVESVNQYNGKPENMSKPVEILYKDNGKDVYGVKIPGVKGKTVTRKDPSTGRAIASESKFTGGENLQKFKPVLSKYTQEKEKEPAKPVDLSKFGSPDQDTSGT